MDRGLSSRTRSPASIQSRHMNDRVSGSRAAACGVRSSAGAPDHRFTGIDEPVRATSSVSPPPIQQRPPSADAAFFPDSQSGRISNRLTDDISVAGYSGRDDIRTRSRAKTLDTVTSALSQHHAGVAAVCGSEEDVQLAARSAGPQQDMLRTALREQAKHLRHHARLSSAGFDRPASAKVYCPSAVLRTHAHNTGARPRGVLLG